MDIHYNLTEEDYLNFNMFHIQNSKTTIKALNGQRFLGPLIFIIASFVLSKLEDIPFLISFIPFFIMSILWIIFYPKYFYSRVIRHSKKMLREGRNDGILGEHFLFLTEEGLKDATTSGETKVNWSGIKNLKEDQHYFYLYNSSVSAYIIPKRDVKNVHEVRDYFRSKIAN